MLSFIDFIKRVGENRYNAKLANKISRTAHLILHSEGKAYPIMHSNQLEQIMSPPTLNMRDTGKWFLDYIEDLT